MKVETFSCIWELAIKKWLQSTITIGNEEKDISSLCKVKDKINGTITVQYVHSMYEKLKDNTKRYYFKSYSNGNSTETHLSRYKRAAVITYAVILSNPLCKPDGAPLEFDPNFLKQRFAVYFALATIIQDFDANKIRNCQKPIFDFSALGEETAEEDTFCISLYKDLFFAEIYENYNVLTMANIYGLLTDRCSQLPHCTK